MFDSSHEGQDATIVAPRSVERQCLSIMLQAVQVTRCGEKLNWCSSVLSRQFNTLYQEIYVSMFIYVNMTTTINISLKIDSLVKD